jgi:hypothetical protein
VPRKLLSSRLALAVTLALTSAATLAGAAQSREAARVALPPLALSPQGSDAGPCTPAQPCRTFDRAYHAARPGQLVRVRAGVYDGNQTVRDDASKGAGPDVVFAAAPGAKVTILHEVRVYGRHIAFVGMRFADGWWEDGQYLTFRSLDTTAVFIHGAHIRVLGGQVYPGPGFSEDYDPQISSGSRGVPPTDVLIDHVWFHGWIRPAGSGFHTECLQAGAGIDVTIRNSRFSDCATHDLFIRSWGTLNGAENTLRNWKIENDFFARTHDGYYAMQLLTDLDTTGRSNDFLIRNNSWAQGMNFDLQSNTRIAVVGNLGELSQGHCSDSHGEIVWSHNVWTDARCGPTDLRAPSGFRNPAKLDLRLRAGSAAINHGDPSSFPRTDIYGRRRPRGRAPDAGAVEQA